MYMRELMPADGFTSKPGMLSKVSSTLKKFVPGSPCVSPRPPVGAIAHVFGQFFRCDGNRFQSHGRGILMPLSVLSRSIRSNVQQEYGTKNL
jgi:hypothetical protein